MFKNADHFLTEESKITYLINKLKGNALSQFIPYSQGKGGFTLKTFNEVMNVLKTAFRDPDKA